MTEKMTPEEAAKAFLYFTAPVLPYGRNTQLAQFIPPAGDFKRLVEIIHAQRAQAVAEAWSKLEPLLEGIIENDKTAYMHHEARPFDGKTPKEDGGTIWWTPRQLARTVLKQAPPKEGEA